MPAILAFWEKMSSCAHSVFGYCGNPASDDLFHFDASRALGLREPKQRRRQTKPIPPPALRALSQQALLLALPVALLLHLALVVLLLALGEPDLQLHAPLRIVQVEGHERVPLLLDLADELADLLGV